MDSLDEVRANFPEKKNKIECNGSQQKKPQHHHNKLQVARPITLSSGVHHSMMSDFASPPKPLLVLARRTRQHRITVRQTRSTFDDLMSAFSPSSLSLIGAIFWFKNCKIAKFLN